MIFNWLYDSKYEYNKENPGVYISIEKEYQNEG